jgi:hypothetical protein
MAVETINYGHSVAGSRAGIPNKIGAAVKSNVIAVFDKIGGREKMAEWASQNLTQFYQLYARLMPTEIISDVTIRNADELSDSELADIAAASRSGVTSETAGETPLN